MNRPLPVTVIAWIIIALSAEGLITLVGGIATPIFTSGLVHVPFSLPATLWISGVTMVVNAALAALMLGGFGWARIVYIVLLAIAILGVWLGHHPISLALIYGGKLIVFGYFFFRHDSNAYFAKPPVGAA